MSKKRNKTVLIFAYYWPPASGPGVQRWLKFVKYLPSFGWDAIVVTPKNGSYPNIDPTLVGDIPPTAQIETTATIEPFRLFNILSGQAKKGNTTSVGMGEIRGEKSFIKSLSARIRANWFTPDARKGWVRFAAKKGSQIINNQPIDMIVTTGPPHSSHLIGLKLRKKYNIPWVADFRDPWMNIYYNKFLPRTQKTIDKDQALEDTVLKSSNSVIVVSDGLKREFDDRAKKVHVIPNGYDEADFKDITSDKAIDAFFRLSYVGNLKSNQNCTNLWQAISELTQSNSDFKTFFKFSVTGNIHDESLSSITENVETEMLELHPFAEHSEAIKKMLDANMLLFLIPDTPNNNQIVTGKIFEYLASKTPLLSIGPTGGDAANILAKCNRTQMIDYNSKELIKSRILTQFEQWKEPQTVNKVKGNEEEQYSRVNLTRQLSNLLDNLT